MFFHTKRGRIAPWYPTISWADHLEQPEGTQTESCWCVKSLEPHQCVQLVIRWEVSLYIYWALGMRQFFFEFLFFLRSFHVGSGSSFTVLASRFCCPKKRHEESCEPSFRHRNSTDSGRLQRPWELWNSSDGCQRSFQYLGLRGFLPYECQHACPQKSSMGRLEKITLLIPALKIRKAWDTRVVASNLGKLLCRMGIHPKDRCEKRYPNKKHGPTEDWQRNRGWRCQWWGLVIALGRRWFISLRGYFDSTKSQLIYHIDIPSL